MRSSRKNLPLLHNIRHRSMIMPVLNTLGSFILTRVARQFIVRLKLFSNVNSLQIGIQIDCSMKIF